MSEFCGVKKNFGFGCMRFPMDGEQVDHAQVKEMVDTFLQNGFNYFDTAHGYLSGKSETALRECLTSRYPRDAYILTNKLSSFLYKTEEDLEPMFAAQLEACGVEYFDFYLMHSQTAESYEKCKNTNAYEFCKKLLKEGKIKHFGISFHDKAEVLERILTEQPQVEVVQIQFNYMDYEDPAVEGRKCYEVCRRFQKPVIVMEPVKGGSLVNLPPAAQMALDELKGGSNASYAIRWAAGFDGVFMVLSGMGDMAMVNDNVGYMKDFVPLNEQEMAAIGKVCDILRAQNTIPCTACRYCTDSCPKHIAIPDLFACMNGKRTFQNWNSEYYYSIHTKNGGKAGDCIGCGKCESLCPQHLPICELLRDVSAEFDK